MRGEWEIELPDAAPHLSAFADPEVLELTGLVLPDELKPVFATRFRRRQLIVEWAGNGAHPAEIEVACDEGSLKAGKRSAPIAELELELKRGDPRALFELAQALREVAPLRLEPRDKAARGYALATGAPPSWRKAASVRLDAGMSVDDALAQILGTTVRHWLDNEAAAQVGADPEGLHQLRVALRRLRSALTLLKPALSEAKRAYWDGELRWLLSHLGRARDLDVFLTETVLAPLAAGRARSELQALCAIAESERRAAHEEVRTTLAEARYGDLQFAFAAWVGRRGWREAGEVDVLMVQRRPVTELAATVLHKRHKKVRKRGSGFAELDPTARHRLRIACKKLRYGLEFFESLYARKDVKPYRKAAAHMQDLLGHLNDVAVAEKLGRGLVEGAPAGDARVGAAFGAGEIVGWYANGLAGLEPRAVAAWKTFADLAPFWKKS